MHCTAPHGAGEGWRPRRRVAITCLDKPSRHTAMVREPGRWAGCSSARFETNLERRELLGLQPARRAGSTQRHLTLPCCGDGHELGRKPTSTQASKIQTPDTRHRHPAGLQDRGEEVWWVDSLLARQGGARPSKEQCAPGTTRSVERAASVSAPLGKRREAAETTGPLGEAGHSSQRCIPLLPPGRAGAPLSTRARVFDCRPVDPHRAGIWSRSWLASRLAG